MALHSGLGSPVRRDDVGDRLAHHDPVTLRHPVADETGGVGVRVDEALERSVVGE